jgi:hypothetical protein
MASNATTSFSSIYLARQNGELVLQQGENPHKLSHANERVLIVGGGVTGLTVRTFNAFTIFHCNQHRFRTRGLYSTQATLLP